ncbi:MBL fold metallo-hydrolase [Bacillus infantis]|uniref:MBL fold metallo-hydrolase n=1 Tax=Bacillus infantis TaxID=324767 RepID=UPI003CF0E131
MKLTVIGPWGGYPKANEASAGYLLEHNGFRLLVDCGSGVLSKMQQHIQPEELDAVIISHYHPDHIADIGVLQHARLIQGFLGKKMDTLPIYAHRENPQEFSKLNYKDITAGKEYKPDDGLALGPFTITFLKTDHPATCYAMRFEAEGKAMVYTADTSYKEELAAFASDASLLVSECNFYGNQNGKNAGHMNSYDAGRLAEKAGAEQLVLTHLPHYGELSQLAEESAREYSGPVRLAAFNDTYTI